MKTENQRPRCGACWGDGYVHDVFSGERMYCDACDGTGFDLFYRPDNDKSMGRVQISSEAALRDVQHAQADQ